MLPMCSFNREVFCLFSHRTATDEYTSPDLVILLSFIFPRWFKDLVVWGFFCLVLGFLWLFGLVFFPWHSTQVQMGVVSCSYFATLFHATKKLALFFSAKLFKMLFCTALPLTKHTGRFWWLDSIFGPFHLSVCLASGMWSLANNA